MTAATAGTKVKVCKVTTTALQHKPGLVGLYDCNLPATHLVLLVFPKRYKLALLGST